MTINPYDSPQTVETQVTPAANLTGPSWCKYAWFLPLSFTGCALLVLILGQSGPAGSAAGVILCTGIALGWIFTIAAIRNPRAGRGGRVHAKSGAIVSSVLSLLIAGLVAFAIYAVWAHNNWLREQQRIDNAMQINDQVHWRYSSARNYAGQAG